MLHCHSILAGLASICSSDLTYTHCSIIVVVRHTQNKDWLSVAFKLCSTVCLILKLRVYKGLCSACVHVCISAMAKVFVYVSMWGSIDTHESIPGVVYTHVSVHQA